MFISRCEFSITLAASATLIVGAKWVPAFITDRYTASTFSTISVFKYEFHELGRMSRIVYDVI